jgi:hypothetical protein
MKRLLLSTCLSNTMGGLVLLLVLGALIGPGYAGAQAFEVSSGSSKGMSAESTPEEPRAAVSVESDASDGTSSQGFSSQGVSSQGVSSRGVPSNGAGETSSTSTSSEGSASSLSASRPSKPMEMSALRLSMAESAFALDPSLENRANLILARERLVEDSCMPKLTQSLQHPGMNALPPPMREACRKELFAVFALDGATPVGFCARDGIDSPNCAAAYKNQNSGSYGGGYQAPAAPEPLRPGQKPNAQDTVALLYQEARQRIGVLQDHESIEARLAIRNVFARLLTLNCAVVRLSLQELPAQNSAALANRDSLLGQPLDPNVPIERYVDVLVQGARVKATPTGGPVEAASETPQEGPPFFRSRLTSDACQFYIQEGLRFEPGLASALCHREGFSSPTCIAALRKERTETMAAIQKERQAKGLPPIAPRTSQSSKAPGFSTF